MSRNTGESIRGIFSTELGREIECTNLFGFHGTSIHTLKYIYTNGHIPGRTEPESVFPGDRALRGDIFVSRIVESQHRNTEAAFTHAVGYAETLARAHEFCVQLGLDLTVTKNQITAYEMTEDSYFPLINPYREYLLSLNISDEQIYLARSNALKYKGFVVGLHQTVATEYDVLDASPDDGWIIRTHTKGVHPSHILGIYPQGEQDALELFALLNAA